VNGWCDVGLETLFRTRDVVLARALQRRLA
jgi:hypothetical protein